MFGVGDTIDLALLRIHNVFELSQSLADTRDESISQYRMGVGSRQTSGDLQCVGVVVVKSLGNTRNQFILWEVVEYWA